MNGKVQVLRGANVMDPLNRIDKVMDVAFKDGVIIDASDLPADAEIIDVSGKTISPGWIDLHVHVYGTLGFGDPDSIGIAQGVTTFVEAGGPGVETIEEFMAFFGNKQLETSLYTGIWLAPLGIAGLDNVEGDIRDIYNLPITKWIDKVAEHRDMLRYLKFGAFSAYGTGPLKIGKGLSEIIDLPIYCHIGEFQQQPGMETAYQIYNIAGEGDMVTHIYHGNEIGILDANGKVLPIVRDAAARGVIFDTGFGGLNFHWDVAEKGFDQNFIPSTISTDFQQFNVAGPVFSLANIMSVFLKLGLSPYEVVRRVTSEPARALRLTDRAGALTPGMPADITVFHIERGEVVLTDTYGNDRIGKERFVPDMVFKAGKPYVIDLERCQDEKNWILEPAEDALPAKAARFTADQRQFLADFGAALQAYHWNDDSSFQMEVGVNLTTVFNEVQAASGLSMRDACVAVLDSLLESDFRIPIAVMLIRAGRTLSLRRLREAAGDAVPSRAGASMLELA